MAACFFVLCFGTICAVRFLGVDFGIRVLLTPDHPAEGGVNENFDPAFLCKASNSYSRLLLHSIGVIGVICG